MSAPTTLETGRFHVIASFNKWVLDMVASLSPLPGPAGLTTANVPFSVKFERKVSVADLTTGPILCVSDVGLTAPARMDVNDRAVYDAANTADVFGSLQQSLIEFVVWGSQTIRPDEDVRIRMVRDAVIGAYRLAGRRDSVGQFIVDPLRIWNFTPTLNPTAVSPTNNFIEKDRAATWVSEGTIDDPDHPELRGWRGLLRIYWIEFFNAP